MASVIEDRNEALYKTPQVHFSNELGACPPAVINLALEGNLELRKTYDYPIELVSGRERVVWATINGVPAGLVLYTLKDDGRVWWSDFSYIPKQFRGMGIYTTLNQAFRALAKKDGRALSVEYHVGLHNKNMQELAVALGAKPVSLKYRYELSEV